MEISKYDPLAINSLPLNIKRAKKYSSVKTILFSLLILALVIVINWKFLKQINANRNQLQTQYFQKKADPQILTQTPLCFTVPLESELNMSVILNVSDETIGQIVYEKVDHPLLAFPYMLPYLFNSTYECFNLSGTKMGSYDNFTIENLKPNNQLKMYLKTMSISNILDEGQAQLLEQSFQIGLNQFRMEFIEVFYQDSWKVNYESQSQFGFSNSSELVYLDLFVGFTQLQKIFLFNKAKFSLAKNIQSYIIFRQNIAEIIARFFAWKGIILLIFAYIFGQYQQSEMKLDICKNRYHSKYLEGFDSSILTEVKRRFSSVKKGLFKQQIMTDYFEKLQKDLDIVSILRKFLLMQSVIQQSDVISKSEDQQLQYFQSPAVDDILNQIDVEEDTNLSKFELLEGQEKQKYEEEDDEKTGCSSVISSIFDSFFSFFDFGTIEFSIVPNKGHGHGSLCNIIFVIVMYGGMIGFLIFIGIFEINQEEEVKTLHSTSTQDAIINITSNMLVLNYFTQFPAFLITYEAHFFLMKNGQAIRALETKQGQQCKYLFVNTTDFEKFNSFETGKWMCLDQDAQVYTLGEQKQYIKINFTYSGMISTYVGIKHTLFNLETQYLDGQLQEKVEGYGQLMGVSQTYVSYYKQHKYQNQINDTQFQTVSQVFKRSKVLQYYGSSPAHQIHGISYYTRSRYQSQSIWDIIDNAWGLMTLLFELLILRVSTMINNKLKKTNLNEEEETMRTNILFILGNIDRLAHGTFQKEINSVPCYFKRELVNQQIHLD